METLPGFNWRRFNLEPAMEAILRERMRGGQVFYVAPRIEDLPLYSLVYTCTARARVPRGFSVAYSLRFIATVFFGPPPVDLPKTPHEPVRWLRWACWPWPG